MKKEGKQTRPHRATLQTRMIVQILAGMATPLTIGCLVLLYTTFDIERDTRDHAQEALHALEKAIIEPDLNARAKAMAQELDEYLIDRIEKSIAWGSADVIVEAARDAHERHTDEGLTTMGHDAVEERFRIEKSLGAYPEADRYLTEQIEVSPDFAEAFFTDRNGYNVGLTNPTSDFVQSDEGWWTDAWSHKLSVGDISYDESAGTWSIDISVRIDDPNSGRKLGVMKSVLSIEQAQKIATRTSNPPQTHVTIADTQGMLIAETQSEHARGRIMSEHSDIRKHRPQLNAVFGASRSGNIDIETETHKTFAAYARTSGAQAYQTIAPRFDGFDWIVIIERNATAYAEPARRHWPTYLSAGAALLCLAVVAGALVLCLNIASHWTHDMDKLQQHGERIAAGNATREAPAMHTKEAQALSLTLDKIHRTLHMIWKSRHK